MVPVFFGNIYAQKAFPLCAFFIENFLTNLPIFIFLKLSKVYRANNIQQVKTATATGSTTQIY